MNQRIVGGAAVGAIVLGSAYLLGGNPSAALLWVTVALALLLMLTISRMKRLP